MNIDQHWIQYLFALMQTLRFPLSIANFKKHYKKTVLTYCLVTDKNLLKLILVLSIHRQY